MDELQQHGQLMPNGEQAIWTCEVRIGDWAQRLTMLRLEASTVWPDPERRPTPLEGSVTPVTDTSGADVPDQAHEDQPAETPATTAPAGADRHEVALDDFDDLPLPLNIQWAGSGRLSAV